MFIAYSRNDTKSGPSQLTFSTRTAPGYSRLDEKCYNATDIQPVSQSVERLTGHVSQRPPRLAVMCRRRWRWPQCRPRSAAPTFGRVVLAGASTPACCPVYRLHERPQPGVVQSGLVSLPVVAARDQKWRVASDKSGGPVYRVGQIKRGQCSFFRRSKARFREFW